MKVTIQKATAEGCRFITLPDNVLKACGWREGDDVFIEPVLDKKGVSVYLVVEKR